LEFTLTYRDPLKSNATVADKQAIRRAVHIQMTGLSQQLPLVQFRPPHSSLLNDELMPGEMSLITQLGAFKFAPLVSQKLALVAELAIVFLRPEAPGSLITQGGDIDNRVKTLLDALRMPKMMSELPSGDTPHEQETPFFCLLEDDNLVTSLSVKTDRLLDPVMNANEVLLFIHIQTKVTVGTLLNLGMG
jgi:hypothetical protein